MKKSKKEFIPQGADYQRISNSVERNKESFLFVSRYGSILDVAWAVFKEGHPVTLFIVEKEFKDVGKGFVPICSNWKNQLD